MTTTTTVSNNTWGFDMETLLLTYNTVIKPSFSYIVPIWGPNIKPSNVAKLQSCQNRGLRLVTGCHQATSVSHLHNETGVLPIQTRIDMLCSQFLASAMRTDHPSHETVLRHPGPRVNAKTGRPLKETLASKYMSVVEPFLSDGVIKEIVYKKTLDKIHSDSVKLAKSQNDFNEVLQGPPPKVSSSECLLSHHHRVILRQLRGKQCSLLRDYLLKIKAVNDDLSPLCSSASQNVCHLFSCPAYPTSLSPLSLWTEPVKTMRFLVSLPTFRSLPPVVLPPARPPPEPDP